MPPRGFHDAPPAAASAPTPPPATPAPAPRKAKRKHKPSHSCLGRHHADKPLLRRLNWLHTGLLTLTPALAVYGLCTTELQWRTAVFAVVYYQLSALGITAGYHRLFSHRAYEACRAVRWLLVCLGSAAVQGSVRWWCRDHRAHHRYVDTPQDPYSVSSEGGGFANFMYAHIGWMLTKQDPNLIGKASIHDLNCSPFIRFQHRNYLWFALGFGFVVPTMVCGLGWGDWRGGYFYAAVLRLVLVHHSTFCINSVAHYFGDSAFSDGHTAKNSWVAALLTAGEGYHNFHHEFPSDYRNAIVWHQYDPTKWFIWVLSRVGLVWGLRRFPKNEIHKGAVQMKQKRLAEEAATVNWGPDPAKLPLRTMADVKAAAAAGKQWLVLDGFVLDVSTFAAEHPGGASLVTSALGKDVSTQFHGDVYTHSNAAGNLATMYRVGRLADTKHD